MKKVIILSVIITVSYLLFFAAGCEKEKIVESTEYIHDIEYVESPPDTVYRVDSVFSSDTVTIHTTDTVIVFDTVVQVEYIHDTVLTYQCDPNEYLAIAALQYYTDPLVIELVNQEYGYDDGWVFYLSSFQLDLNPVSSDVYDIYGYIDYWTPDWSGFYPLEFYWRLTYTGGDPADLNNWQLSEPISAAADRRPGVRLKPDAAAGQRSIR